ncbi:hypothetical protein TcCL_ESM03385 [Trypanosoma cruzi]|nr:hypothetical protein TcCL_Unassigned03477 [Trypanosoma cruzi]RNC59003.1 hypothetical protein TcCL_ESM03385 [Trypanosoma cruzi]
MRFGGKARPSSLSMGPSKRNEMAPRPQVHAGSLPFLPQDNTASPPPAERPPRGPSCPSSYHPNAVHQLIPSQYADSHTCVAISRKRQSVNAARQSTNILPSK